MKDVFYFQHDYNSRNDPKLQTLLMKYGNEGIGIFWCLVEMLYEQEGKLRLDLCDSYAFALRCDATVLRDIIDICFYKDDEFFWSNSVNSRLKIRKIISKRASANARKRWTNQAKRSDATAMPPHSNRNAIKERKGKEIKGKEKEIKGKEKNKESKPQSHVSYLDSIILLEELNGKFPDIAVEEELEKMKDWLLSKGEKKDDYAAFARNWLRGAKPKEERGGVVDLNEI